MQKNNRQSNARFLGPIIGLPIQIVHIDQYSQVNPFGYQSNVPLGDMIKDDPAFFNTDNTAKPGQSEQESITKLTA